MTDGVSVPQLQLHLLGGYRLQVAGAPLELPTSRNAAALLAYLSTQADQLIARNILANLLWSDTPTKFARTHLRQCLVVLRQVQSEAGVPCIHSTSDALSINGASITSDLNRFNTLCSDGDVESLNQA